MSEIDLLDDEQKNQIQKILQDNDMGHLFMLVKNCYKKVNSNSFENFIGRNPVLSERFISAYKRSQS